MTEDRGQKAEDREQWSEVGKNELVPLFFFRCRIPFE